jgi:4-diphosphocytidyl-2-C-methyl-D-erythritol kinase
MEVSHLHYMAFAKLNLFLQVLGKREDGYHDIHSLMVTVGVADTLRFEKTPSEISLHCESPHVPAGIDNLCWRAAGRLKELGGFSGGAQIILEKNIPVAAGLGGGSSDAACTLVGLNRLWQLGLRPEELAEIAKDIGSDVPFFIRGGAQIAEGRGEKLTPLEGLSELWFVILSPPARVSSKEAYSAVKIELTRARHRTRINTLGMGLDAASVAGSLQNDLESGVMEICPEVRELKEALLSHGALGSLMSGSGPAVFGIARDQTSASAIASRIERSDLSAFAVRTVREASIVLDED